MIICENCFSQYNSKKRSITLITEDFSPALSLDLHLCNDCWKEFQIEVKIAISKFQLDKEKLKILQSSNVSQPKETDGWLGI